MSATLQVNFATVLETKLFPPALRNGSVPRTNLVERIVAAPLPVTTICAPAGYGKTTLMAQYAASLSRPVAWVSLDTSDDDPALLLTEIATALDRIVPVDPLVFRYLLAPEPALAEVIPRLINALARGHDVALILDDVHLVRASQSLDQLAMLCEHLPVGTRLIVGAREMPKLPLARLRGQGLLLELGPEELALSAGEAHQLLEAEQVSLDADAFDVLYQRTEGWPAGMYLAAITAGKSTNPSRAMREFGGDDRDIFDYFSDELLVAQPADRLTFLLHTSVLDRFTAALCDAVLDRDDSALALADLERSNSFLVSLDHRRQWFRYHHLFGEVLRAAFERQTPRLAATLHQRASRWHELHGTPSEAIEHALASHDRRRAAELIASHGRVISNSGKKATLRRWMLTFSDADLADDPPLAAGGAWIMAEVGDRAQARRFISILERTSYEGRLAHGERSTQSAVALWRAFFAWEGVSHARHDAELGYRLEPVGHSVHQFAAGCLGMNLFVRGRSEAALPLLEQAAMLGDAAAGARVANLGVLALLHLGEARLAEAESATRDGLAVVDRFGLDGSTIAGAVFAARACLDVELGDHQAARRHLQNVVSLIAGSIAMPWWSILIGTYAGRVARKLGDTALAGSILLQARRELGRYPDAGTLPQLLAREERALKAMRRGAGVLLEPLTETEQRVLELATTHLTAEGIARSMSISRNTVKTHFQAIYAKLQVSSRGEAIARAQSVGLIGRVSSS